jgi:hypothetical protein
MLDYTMHTQALHGCTHRLRQGTSPAPCSSLSPLHVSSSFQFQPPYYNFCFAARGPLLTFLFFILYSPRVICCHNSSRAVRLILHSSDVIYLDNIPQLLCPNYSSSRIFRRSLQAARFSPLTYTSSLG